MPGAAITGAGPRYAVGIDLGTTHCALASVSLAGDPRSPGRPVPLEVPQLVAPGEVQPRALLPSFLYLASPSEFPSGALDLPWATGREFAVGELARAQGAQVPVRLVSSAKSWLSHAGVDRTARILPPLPPGAEPVDVPRVSPVEASARYLAHLREAWDRAIATGDPACALARQDVYLTVPASFDAVARELTVRAAADAGLDVTLLEEPQAAFYSWLAAQGDAWRGQLRVGDVVLVCDVGGGTTDFSLIAVSDDGGELRLDRVAVGEHILLGGDNMDLALAGLVAQRLAAPEGPAGNPRKLDAWQLRALALSCRAAKEALLAERAPESAPVTILGRGRSVIGGAIRAELSRSDVEAVILDGFFPRCERGERPAQRRRAGLQELGLPYASDPAVTRHLAKFLSDHRAEPTAILFNGGVMKSAPLRTRIADAVGSWTGEWVAPPRVLEGADLDLAVALGAAAFGRARRGGGVRIRGGTARAYYVGVESSLPAVPGMEPPLKAICVAPMGMEEGTETEPSGEEFGLVVGEPAEFRFLSSTTRDGDRVGAVHEDLDGIEETSPMFATLPAAPGAAAAAVVPVRLRAKVTEVGTLEVWCVARDGQRWKLEYDTRGDQQR